MKTRILILSALLLAATGAAAQTSRQVMNKDIRRAGANYWAYPGPQQKTLTPAPAGYEPFYISHYGRHGSRYMTDNKYYVALIAKLDSAQAMQLLTPRGEALLGHLKTAYAASYMRDGDLTPLGGRQHREIAQRMYQRFPALLSQPLEVDARSSTVGRCMISMFNFTQQLQGMNPQLQIRMDASKHDMPFVVGDYDRNIPESAEMEEYKRQLDQMKEKAQKGDRLMKVLFTNPQQAAEFVDGKALMDAMYRIAAILQNSPELEMDLTDYLTKEEFFQLWQVKNLSWLLGSGLVPGTTPQYLAQVPVRDSIQSIADRVIRSGKPGLTLRFSHDSSVLPLSYLMGLKEAMGATRNLKDMYKHISVDRLIPMAANIQLIFYRKDGSDDILVKFLLNENETTLPALKSDVAPYYHWSDVKAYWASRED